MELFQKIADMAEDLLPEMTAIRRDLHKHAEMGWLEMRTSSIISPSYHTSGSRGRASRPSSSLMRRSTSSVQGSARPCWPTV